MTAQPHTVWAKHEKVKRGWMPVITYSSAQAAIDDVVARQDRVRRSKEPVRFKVLPLGEEPTDARAPL